MHVAHVHGLEILCFDGVLELYGVGMLDDREVGDLECTIVGFVDGLVLGRTVGRPVVVDGLDLLQEVGSQGPQISGNSSLPIITHAWFSLKDPPPDVCNQLIRSPHE